MNKNIITVLLIFLVISIGIAWFFRQSAITNSSSISPVPTNADALRSKNVGLTTESDVEYFENAHGYFARPEEEGQYAGVVMIHENRGLRPEIRVAADNLAQEGYMVLAVDLYKGKVVETQEEAREISAGFDQSTGTENLKAAVNYLREKGATKIASLGWCFGGRQSIELATSGEKLDATIVYYGGNMASTVEELKPISWPVLGIFGGQDQSIPVEKVNEFETSLNTLGVENEIYVYPGVGHAFANPSGTNYAPDETSDAWNKTLAFLDKHL